MAGSALVLNGLPHYVTIKVLASTFGDEEADRLPFAYATYDQRDAVVIVTVGGRSGDPVAWRHMVGHPAAVVASEAGAGFKVVEADGSVERLSGVGVGSGVGQLVSVGRPATEEASLGGGLGGHC